MRRLAEELGAEAMSLYYHVGGKEDLLDGIADAIVAEINDVVGTIDVPSAGANWKTAVRRRILSAREVWLRHPWAPASWRHGPAPAWPCCCITTACSSSCETAVSPTTRSTTRWCDDQTEFEFGLDLILDGLDEMRKPA